MSASWPERSPREVHGELSRYRVVDVREHAEWHGELGRVPGSCLIPMSELENRLDELRGDVGLLLVCRSGRRSAMMCARLVELGLPAPTNLAGGMIAWNEAGLPVERSNEPDA